MTRLALIAGFLFLAACDQSAVTGPPAPKPDAAAQRPMAKSILSPSGWAGVRVGMNRARAVEAMGGTDSAPLPDKEVWESCYFLQPAGVEGVQVMIENGRVARVDVTAGAADIITDTGLAPGASADEVRAAYGAQLEIEPHKYDPPPALYLTWWDRRNDQGVRYVTDGQGIVTAILVGGPAIRYVEGCS